MRQGRRGHGERAVLPGNPQWLLSTKQNDLSQHEELLLLS
jgi:hypothetical protein